jgi:uncharacterized protein YggE
MRYRLLNAALLATVVVSGVTLGADPPQRTISVTGEGKASAAPNMATVDAGVVAEDPDVGKALTRSTEKMTRVLGVIGNAGIAPDNVQTTGFTVEPVRVFRTRQPSRIAGYRVRQRVRVWVRDLGKVGGLLGRLVQAGSNEVGRVTFGVQNPTRLANEARRGAVANAYHRADVYARSAGVRVGRVLTISEQPISTRPIPVYGRASAAAPVNVPVATGRYEVRSTVHVVYALRNRR